MDILIIIIGIILTFLAILSLGSVGIAGYLVYNELKKKRQLDELIAYSEIYSTIDNIDALLEQYIQTRYDEYKAFHADKYTDYISENMQQDIIRSVYSDVVRKMSPTFLTQLRVLYNFDIVDEVIMNKILLIVTSDIIEINSGIEAGSLINQ